MTSNELNEKLKELSGDIVSLLKEGYSQAQILKYLSEYHNLKVSRAILSREIANLKEANDE